MAPSRTLPLVGACLAGLAWLLPACTPHYPGESVGFFQVTGSLQDNTCGEQAVPAIDPVVFPVEIRRDGGEVWWRRPNAPLVPGSVQPDGTFRFRTTFQQTLFAPDAGTQTPSCVVTQQEVVQVQVDGLVGDAGVSADAGGADGGGADGGTADAPHLSGTHHIEISPTPGSVCTSALAVAGGSYLALPCSVDYTLDGESTKAF